MTDKKLRSLANVAYRVLKRRAPVDTGTLKGAIEMHQIKEGAYRVFIDGSIIPYTVYTNEQWISPYWGKHRFKNPNYHWIDDAVDEIVRTLSTRLGGEVNANSEEILDRRDNKNYWDSAEGRSKLASWGMTFDDTRSV